LEFHFFKDENPSFSLLFVCLLLLLRGGGEEETRRLHNYFLYFNPSSIFVLMSSSENRHIQNLNKNIFSNNLLILLRRHLDSKSPVKFHFSHLAFRAKNQAKRNSPLAMNSRKKSALRGDPTLNIPQVSGLD